MYFSSLVLSFTLVLIAVAEPLEATKSLPEGFQLAQRFRREANGLEARQIEVDPKILCGDPYDDCGNGFCCMTGTECVGTITEFEIPACKDPDSTTGILKGTSPAYPYKNPESALSSLNSVLAEFTGAPNPGGMQTTNAGSQITGTGQPANPQDTGAAALSHPRNFGTIASLVIGVWGAAALAGAGWFIAI